MNHVLGGQFGLGDPGTDFGQQSGQILGGIMKRASKPSRCICEIVSSLGLMVLSASVHSSFAAASEMLPPSHLRCGSLQDPLGIDITRPQLSWQLQDTRRGVKQTAYEILVASRAELLEAGKTDVW